jgi:hypothetical protein
LLAAYETSGLTQKEFARREGVRFPTFTAWLVRHRRAQSVNVRPATPYADDADMVESVAWKQSKRS